MGPLCHQCRFHRSTLSANEAEFAKDTSHRHAVGVTLLSLLPGVRKNGPDPARAEDFLGFIRFLRTLMERWPVTGDPFVRDRDRFMIFQPLALWFTAE
jgi:hypothetical protein